MYLSSRDVTQFYVQHPGDTPEDADGSVFFACLEFREIRPRDLRRFGKLFLGKPAMRAKHSNCTLTV